VDEVNTERMMLSKLKHKGILNMKAAWADKNYYYLLIDYAINGDLSQFLMSKGRYYLIENEIKILEQLFYFYFNTGGLNDELTKYYAA